MSTEYVGCVLGSNCVWQDVEELQNCKAVTQGCSAGEEEAS